MRASAALLLRGMRWRLGTSLLTVLTSTIAVGAAVLGPLYLHTADDSVVRSMVKAAAVDARGATVSAPPGQVVTLGQVQRAGRRVEDVGGVHRFYGAPIITAISGVTLTGAGGSPVRSELLSRTGICGVLQFLQGSCSMAPGDVALSARSARELGVSRGDIINADVQGRSAPLRLRVTGVYAVPDLSLPYWWGGGAGYFGYGHIENRFPELDAFVTSSATARAVPAQDVPAIEAQIPLNAASVALSNQGYLQRADAAARATLAVHAVVLSTQLPQILAAAAQQQNGMATIVAIASVQLVLLSVWILGNLLVRSSEARQAEMRVARLRGFPPLSLLAVTAAEPVLLCLFGFVLGVAVAWGAVVVARDRLLDPAAAVSPDVWVFAALALTVLAIAGALSVATLRFMRSSGASGDRTAAPASARRWAMVADAVLLVLAAVALVALATSGSLGGRANPIASAAPGLIALGTAVVAVQVVRLACRLGVSASADSERVAAFLALRQIVRRPAVLRVARVLIIALGLACFASAAWSVSRSNRVAVAGFGVGSNEVVTVTPHGPSLEQAVDRVDPRGRFAMAAVEVTTPSSTLLAVDASRLPAVASWPRGISGSTISATSRELDQPTLAEVILPGAPIRVSATTTGTSEAAAGLGSFDLSLWVFNPQSGTTTLNLGPLHAGAWIYRASPGFLCPSGCRLAGLAVAVGRGRTPPGAGAIHISVTRVATRSPSGAWATVPADLLPHGWLPRSPGVQAAFVPGSGLAVTIPVSVIGSYNGPLASPNDRPAVLPGAVTSTVESLNGGATPRAPVPSQGLDGNTLNVSPVVTASALPRVGTNAVMVDLDLLSRFQESETTPYTSDEVWLGPAAPRDALARLEAAGLRVDTVQTASAAVKQFDRSGPALADDFLLVATIVALLAAAASVLGALGATTRQRATELTALEIGGIHRRVLARSLAIESLVLAATALFGVAAGVLAAVMAIPSLPELGTPAVIPLQYGLPGGLLAIVSAAAVLAVLLATATVALILLRRMSPLLLRSAPNDTSG
jgi:putative ABC transport system permease protein